MCTVALVLACLACASNARRVDVIGDGIQGETALSSRPLAEIEHILPLSRHVKATNPREALELFLQMLNPVVGWQVSGMGLGGRFSMNRVGTMRSRSRLPPKSQKSTCIRTAPQSLPLMLGKHKQGAAFDLRRQIPSARHIMAAGLATVLVAARAGAVPAAWAAAAAETGEHLHLGQKIAQFFRGFGFSDELVITLISALPAVELRGGVPVGIWMGMPALKVLALCVLGNMIPIYPLLFALKFGPVQKLLKPVLDRAQRKAEAAFADPKSRAALLAAFVGIPLPGTGAWTGAMGAFLLGMPVATAMTAIFAGVVVSGLIMSAISQGGVFGACTGAVLLGSMLTQVKFGGKKLVADDPSK